MEGKTVSHYRILEKIGEGGMGQVYLAEDTSLERKVALKFLPEYLPAEDVAHKRFIREAKSAAAIDHPYICNIHEVVQTDDGQDFIVMEYVQGQTLKDRLGQGKLPIKEALQIGSEVAEALEEAHSNGVIHRDLKPSNIMVTPTGHAKVLDFGLAKRVTRDKEDLTSVLTREGTTLGTLAYMSPEQLRGSPVDARADVFSLGVVLYEMLTGVHPFSTGTQAETVNAILSEHPSPLSRYVEGVPELLQHTIKKMLAKQPGERYQTVHEIRTNLTKVMEEITSPTPLAEPEKKRGMWIGAGVVLLGVIAVLIVAVFRPGLHRGAEGPPEPIKIRPLTTDGALKRDVQISPDGEHVAYSARISPGKDFSIFVMSVGEGTTPLQLTNNPAREHSPVWSPDGRQIAFVRATNDEKKAAIYMIPAPLGGQERKIADLSSPSSGSKGQDLWAISWVKNGPWLAAAEQPSKEKPSRIVLISVETGEKKLFTDPPERNGGDSLPAFSPDGTQIAFVRTSTWYNSDYWVQAVEGGQARQLTFESYINTLLPSWTPDGREIIFGVGGDAATQRLFRVSAEGGVPVPITAVGMGTVDFSVHEGCLVFVRWQGETTDIWRIPGPESSEELVPERVISGNPIFSDELPRVSPDGKRIAFVSSRTDANEIWVANADGSNQVQLSRFGRHSEFPTWSRDGKEIAFSSSTQVGGRDVYVVDSEGGEPRRFTEWSGHDGGASWSYDNLWIYFASDRGGVRQLWRIPAEGGEPTRVNEYEITAHPVGSADGKFLYYFLMARGIMRVSLEGGEPEQILEDIQLKNWSLQDNRLYFGSQEPSGFSIHFLDLDTGRKTELYREIQNLYLHSLGVGPKEDWIYYSTHPRGKRQNTDLWLVENFQ